MYSEILRIIEGGLCNDKRKIVSYSNRLANRFEKNGDPAMSKCILDIINDVSRNGISTMDEFRNIPVDPKDIWPPEPIRDLIESLRSNHLDNGILIGCINSRGPTSILDGGTEERKLAEQYKKDSLTVQARWPRTFRILRRIANLYTKEAHRENQEAQIYQDLD
mgnify:CR=1 FL=1